MKNLRIAFLLAYCSHSHWKCNSGLLFRLLHKLLFWRTERQQGCKKKRKTLNGFNLLNNNFSFYLIANLLIIFFVLLPLKIESVSYNKYWIKQLVFLFLYLESFTGKTIIGIKFWNLFFCDLYVHQILIFT